MGGWDKTATMFLMKMKSFTLSVGKMGNYQLDTMKKLLFFPFLVLYQTVNWTKAMRLLKNYILIILIFPNN